MRESWRNDFVTVMMMSPLRSVFWYTSGPDEEIHFFQNEGDGLHSVYDSKTDLVILLSELFGSFISSLVAECQMLVALTPVLV